ncbi:molybdenum cofactor biosynthesis protein MoaE [Sphingomonas sp.]|uniref:molybdenum cofactor biosynthesis protein MoaE n=1 Tax=Sphingomonas sp. TaxID=28214 RepID=UPI000DB81593|nr:molybdenum cofactor biosynthesis protein MoaE [Sphingomonas sp.]PZU08658.1 MAG: molybdopterin synthase catalytic subunit [Sphingomonas sp.]
MISVRVQPEPFDPGAELVALETLGGGAVASFTGIVRGEEGPGGGLVELLLEHHPGMTAKAMEAIAADAARRWPLLGIVLVHRIGAMTPGERIVFVGTASRHRAAALEACAFLIDWLKTGAPFWKRARFADGTSQWVEARAEDDAAASRWV